MSVHCGAGWGGGARRVPLGVTYRACARASGMRATCEPAAANIAASAPQIPAALTESA